MEIVEKANRRLGVVLHPFLKIPGMMGYQERMNLYHTCKYELDGSGIAVEFGSFLGASTRAIQEGMMRNKNISHAPKLHVYDCFRCPIRSAFSAHVRKFAALGKVDSLLKEDQGWLCFYDAFLTHIDRHKSAPVVHKCFVSDLAWQPNNVEFLHLDLPKDWSQSSFIARSVFPDLVVGARVLFQDFGYHWSAELIAMADYFVRLKIFKPYRLTDTTLSVEVSRKISLAEIEELNDLMASPQFVIDGIENSRVWCGELKSKSIDIVLLMAKAQYHYVFGDNEKTLSIMAMILNRGQLDEEARMRMIDLFNCAFKMEKSYE